MCAVVPPVSGFLGIALLGFELADAPFFGRVELCGSVAFTRNTSENFRFLKPVAFNPSYVSVSCGHPKIHLVNLP